MGSAHDIGTRAAEVRRILLRARNGPLLAKEWDLEWPTCEARALTAEVNSAGSVLAHQVQIVAALTTIARNSAEAYPDESATLGFWHELLLRESAHASQVADALEVSSIEAETALRAFREGQQNAGPSSPSNAGHEDEADG